MKFNFPTVYHKLQWRLAFTFPMSRPSIPVSTCLIYRVIFYMACLACDNCHDPACYCASYIFLCSISSILIQLHANYSDPIFYCYYQALYKMNSLKRKKKKDDQNNLNLGFKLFSCRWFCNCMPCCIAAGAWLARHFSNWELLTKASSSLD